MTTSITSASVNVKDFGATGDGVTLDRAAIQSAIDALNAIYVATGRQQTLAFSDGVFLLDAVNYLRDDGITVDGAMSLLLRDGVHLQGRGTLKLMDSAYGPGAFFRIVASRDATRLSNASISGITIDGNSAHQLASNQCNNIVLECLDNVVVDNVTSLNANGTSIMLRGTVDSWMTNCAVRHSKVQGATNIGIQCAQFDGLRIDGNSVSACANNGIDVYGDVQDVLECHGRNFSVVGNIVNGALVGIFLETVRLGTVTGNVATNCSLFGVTVNRGNGEPNGIVISGNEINAIPTGVRVTGDTGGVSIRANSISDFTDAGIKLGDGAGGGVSYVDVSGNFFRPASNTVPIIAIAGAAASFNTGRDNTVLSAGIAASLLCTNTAIAPYQNHVGGFRVLPFQSGPDLFGQFAQIGILSTLTGSAAAVKLELTGPHDVVIPDNSGGKVMVTCYQATNGAVYLEQPYLKTAGTLVLGPQTVVANGPNPCSIAMAAGNIRITPLAAYTNLAWGLHYVAMPSA